MSVSAKNAQGVAFTWNASTTAKTGEQTPRHVQVPDTAGGPATFRSLDLSDPEVVSASAGQVYGWFIANQSADWRYIKFYDRATGGTIGTGTPAFTLPWPAGQAGHFFHGSGIPFATGIVVEATQLIADGDTTAPDTNDVVITVFYKS